MHLWPALIQVLGLAAVVAAIGLLVTWVWALLAGGVCLTLIGVTLELGGGRRVG